MSKTKVKLRRALSGFLAFVLLCTIAGTGMAAFAADDIYYIDENGEEQLLTEEYTSVSDTGNTWSAGWYVLSSSVTKSSRITISGTVNLILEDGYTLTASSGIAVNEGNTLNIYAQAENTGKLTANASSNFYAGIGGDNGSTCGTITVSGGTVTANGKMYGAGIGGGWNGSGGTVTINGGTVTATGSDYGAGIGGGYNGSGGTVTINGGTITANGGQSGAGIGGGNNGKGGSITINGGTVTAKGGTYGTGIGGGQNGSGNTVTINGGIVTATAGGGYAAGIGGGSKAGGEITINDGTVKATGTTYAAGIGGGYNGSGGTITINGGTVTATTGDYGAGIGGGRNSSGGTITISGGTVTAKNTGNFGAGIGGGDSGAGGTITIKGGLINATGGIYAAGIGGGRYASGGTITISGGTVTATGDVYGYGAGIGKGLDGSNGSFRTGEDGCAVIYTDSIGDTSDRDNWSGIISRSSTTGDAIVYGAPVITTDEEIPSGCTAVIEEDKTVTIVSDTTFTNNGTIYQDYGSTFAKEGTFTDDDGKTYYEIAGDASVTGNTVTYSNKTYALAGENITADHDCIFISLTEWLILDENLSFTMPSEPVKSFDAIALVYDANGLTGTLPENVAVTKETGSNKVTVGSGSGLGNDFDCWNTASHGSGVTYNEGDTITLTENTTLYARHIHHYSEDGFCTTTSDECSGYYQPANWNETEGYYEISNLGQLYWFMSLVDKDNSISEFTSEDMARGASANGTLTADIGTSANPVTKNCSVTYSGMFDGQGHTITMALSGSTDVALFPTTDGATIENLYTAGNITASGKNAASLVGEASNSLTIKKCVSSVDITSTVNGDGTSGGIVANLTSSAEYTIEDCAFTGSLIGTGTTSCGGIAGWVNGSASGTVENCWVTADLELSGSDTSSANIARNADSAVINCYYLSPIREDSTQGIQKTEEEFASGEVTWLLDGGVMEDSTVITDATTDGTQVWYQNVDNDEEKDNTPVLLDHGTVYYCYKDCGETQPFYTNTFVATPAHKLNKQEAKNETCTEDGNNEYWYCSECGKCFNNENAETEIPQEDAVIPAFGHTWQDAPKFTWEKIDGEYVCTATIFCATDSSHTVTSNCEITKYTMSNGIVYYFATASLYDSDNNDAFIGTYTDVKVAGLEESVAQNLNTGVYYISLQDAIDAAEDGETIQLLADVCTDTQIVVAGKTITLDLNDCKIYTEDTIGGTSTSSLISVQADENEVPGNLTIVDTGVNGIGSIEAKENDVYACDVSGGSTLTIEAGMYAGNVSAVYVTKGSLVVNGGTFSVQQTSTDNSDPYGYVLNCDDESFAADTASIVVTGGSFVGFNPESCAAEGENTNLIDSSNYHSISTEDGNVDIYTVGRHSYYVQDTEEDIVAPTCDEYGYTIYTCECGVEYETDWTEPLGHKWNEGVTTTPATCGEDGVKTYTCQNDSSHQYTEVIPATGEHTWGTEGEITTPATCDEAGVTTYTCTVCEATKEEAIDPLGHNYSAEQDEVTGEYLYVTFTWDNEDIDNLNEVTCTATFTCTECGYTEEVTCTVSHDENDDTPASCTEPADYDVKATASIASRNGATVEATADDHITGVALGHEWNNGEVTTPPTCMAEGETTYTCKREGCSATYTEPIEKTNHDYHVIYKVEPTCTDPGTYYYACMCEACGENCACNPDEVTIDGETFSYTYSEEIDATGHSLVNVAANSPTCTEAGNSEYYECALCGATFADEDGVTPKTQDEIVIKATGHTEVTDPAVDPTCTETGLTEGSHCKVCDEVLKAQEVTEALGHNYGEPEFSWNGYTSCEATISCTRTDCTKEITEKAAITSVTTSPTCTEPGQTVYTATVTFAVDSNDAVATLAVPVTYTETKTEILDALGHTPLDAVVENYVEPTCTEKGSYDSVIYCETCGEEINRESYEIAMVEHTPLDAVVENYTAATCMDKGSYESVIYCGVCDAELSREGYGIEALGHTPLDAVTENSVEPTCTEKGSYDSVIYCSVCNAELSREGYEIEALGHTPLDAVTENSVEPTCTETGSYDIVIYCSVCDAELSREGYEIEAPGHTPLDAVTENYIEPTCTEKGSYESVVYCGVCDAELSREGYEIEALGHTPLDAVVENYNEPTCTETGSYDSVIYCSVCDAELSREYYEIEALGHTPLAAVTENSVEPNCTEKGSYDSVVYCSVCGEEISRESVEVAALGHSLTYVAAKDATTTAEGNTEYYYCTVCGRYYADASASTEITLSDTVIPAIELVLTPVEVTDAATGKTITVYLDEATGIYYADAIGSSVVIIDSIIIPETSTEESTSTSSASIVGKQYSVDGLKYEVTADSSSKRTAKVIGATKTSVSSVRVPASIKINGKSYKVTAIGNSAFKNYKKLASVAIASNVTSIGSKAFANCSALTKVTGCTEVTKIGEYAFYGCSSLKNVNNCAKVTSIGKKAFCRCTSLTRVGTETGVTSLSKLKSIGSYAFYACTKITAVNIPANVKTINQKAFCRCTALTKVTGCKNVEAIKRAAFYGCTKLSRVSGCQKVTSIDEKAFCRCTKLTRIGSTSGKVVLAKVKTIGEKAFYGCTSLKKVNVSSTSLKSIGAYAFKKCTKMTAFTCKSTKLNSIGKQAFYGDKSLKTVTLKTTKLTSSNVKASAFKGINSKCTFKVPSSVVSKYKKAFTTAGASKNITVKKA